ncbi:MAG: aspartyl-tRNA synthetase [Cryptosporangiaceae bacterium]|nr:aspartyl-tRNA synthetase [Cryptosporangiaceae bacterium]
MTNRTYRAYRSASAGTLRAAQDGQSVTLAGWVSRRRDHGGVIFIDLRDASGYVQVVFREGDMAAAAHALRSEYCVRVEGTVGRRPEGNENPDLPTGEIEVTATALEVLSESAPLPFPIDGQGAGEVGEEARLKYRYLDLRRSGPGSALRLRSKVNKVARDVLVDRDFIEIETPTLTRSTPEGARDFLVPVRLQPGNWYALPQSPQLFKQLLMVAGMERYFQIARCYRDEDFRADRQPEFTQLDIEVSFATQDDIIALGEAVIAAIWRDVLGYEIALPIPRMTYAESMTRFGIDRPDLRFGCELTELTSYFAGTGFRVFQAAYVGAVVMPGGAAQTRKELDGWQEWARSRGAKGLAYVLLDAETGEARGPVAKNLSEEHLTGLADAVGAKPGDAVFFAAGEKTEAQTLLGAARLEIGKRANLIDESRWEFVWIVDFPMFEPDGEGGWTAIHHPFTAPTPEWLDRFADDPGAAISDAYDIVLNGTELGGGSVRIHRADTQEKAFAVLGLSEEEARSKFGFLLEAFQYGPPPHAGIALGWDRLCAMLANSESIRDVIAFPKTASGGDPLTGAPTPITPAQRKEAGIAAKPKDAGAPPADVPKVAEGDQTP